MAVGPRYCPSCLSSTSGLLRAISRPKHTFQSPRAPLPLPATATAVASYHASASLSAKQSENALKYRRKDTAGAQKKRKTRTRYLEPDLKDVQQFSLVDAMRYLRAAEVGRGPKSSKYELHVRLRSPKNGPVVRNRLQLPHPVKTELRIAVICDPDSAQAKAAIASGASVVGEETIFDAVRDGRIEFDRCLCHQDSLPKLSKSGVARILGPRGLMPSAKLGTVVKDVGAAVKNMVGGSEYRERLGVVRLAIGQLGFSPEEVQRNIRAFIEGVRADIARLSDVAVKEIHEVVLSSTNGPGLSLNGEFRAETSPPAADLSTL